MVHPLRLERAKRGWTQWHVAYNAGVPVNLLSYEERYYRALSEDQKSRVANLFSMAVTDLFPVNMEEGI